MFTSSDNGQKTRRLALRRRDGETIEVNGPAVIKFTRCRRGKCEVAVEAEDDVKILRGELVGTPAKNEEPTRAA